MNLVALTCPHCGFHQNVEKTNIPTNISSVKCPICDQSFSIGSDTYEKAGFFSRALAIIIDILILEVIDILIVAIIYKVSGSSGKTVNTVSSVVSMSVFFSYFTVITSRWGSTPGKALMGLKVVDKNGKTPDVMNCLMREVIGKMLSCLTLGIGFLMPLFTKERQALHDKLARTYVIVKFD